MKISTVWDKRWQSLKAIISNIEKEGLPGPACKALLVCLEAFGESQFRFFYDGFQEDKLYPSALYPVEYALRTTLDQAAYDITAVHTAAYQHAQTSQHTRDTLKKAEQLAQLALNLAVKSKLLKAATNISYFDKSPHIRTIPYAPLALVGVPFTSTAVPRDFLATPHEIGHHVYRHSPGLLADLRDRLPIQPEWCSRWQEEIFADVYGCLVAGPVIGLDFQDILFDHSLENFMSDDGDHPVEAIRPYGYIKVLTKLGFPNAAKALKKRWRKMLAARNRPQSFIPYGEFSPVSLETAKEAVETFAEIILDYLTEARNVKPANYWSQDLAAGEKPESLYQKFDKWASQPLGVTVPELQTDGDKVGVLVDGQLRNKRRIGTTQTWIDDIKRQNNHKLPPAAWEPALSSEGWNVGLPGEGWPP